LADTFDDLAVAFALSQQRGLPQLSTPPEGPEEQAERRELRRRLAAHLETVSDEERVVIERYYFRNDTMQVIARDRGVSVSWISRLHTRALRKLRPALRAEEEHGVEARAGPETGETSGE
jgi:RNA polymerase sigma factor for flagellar operon FliA